MSINAIARVRSGTRVDVDGPDESPSIELQEPLEKGGVSVYATSPEGFERLAAAATEAARRMRGGETTPTDARPS